MRREFVVRRSFGFMMSKLRECKCMFKLKRLKYNSQVFQVLLMIDQTIYILKNIFLINGLGYYIDTCHFLNPFSILTQAAFHFYAPKIKLCLLYLEYSIKSNVFITQNLINCDFECSIPTVILMVISRYFTRYSVTLKAYTNHRTILPNRNTYIATHSYTHSRDITIYHEIVLLL